MGLLAIPVLSGSAAYAIAEAFGWRFGLQTHWSKARPFYAVIIVSTAIGVAMNLVGINPIDALFWLATIGMFLALAVLAYKTFLAPTGS